MNTKKSANKCSFSGLKKMVVDAVYQYIDGKKFLSSHNFKLNLPHVLKL